MTSWVTERNAYFSIMFMNNFNRHCVHKTVSFTVTKVCIISNSSYLWQQLYVVLSLTAVKWWITSDSSKRIYIWQQHMVILPQTAVKGLSWVYHYAMYIKETHGKQWNISTSHWYRENHFLCILATQITDRLVPNFEKSFLRNVSSVLENVSNKGHWVK